MFDIDHLYLASFNYKEDGKLTEKQVLQNRVLNDMLTLLKDTGNSMHMLYKSIDNDTELLTNIANQLPEEGSNKARAFNFGTLHEQIARRNDYITGKFGIGPFALNVTSHVLTRIYGVKFKSTRFTEAAGITDLGRVFDDQNNYIDAWISAFINAHVDIVKDPYISKMNVNKYTYNMINLLIRAGYGDAAMWFITQPIIVGMANAYNNANSLFMRTKGTSIYSNLQAAVADAVAQWVPKELITDEAMNKFLDFKNKVSITRAIEAVSFIKDHTDTLREIAIMGHSASPNTVVELNNGEKTTVGEVQQQMFFAWKALEKYSIGLGNLVQRTKIDTKKHGKSLLDLHNYFINYNNMFHPVEDTSLFEMSTLDRLVNDSWIEQKTNLVCTIPFQILGELVFEGNLDYLRNIIDLYIELNGNREVIKTEWLEVINKAVKAQIKSQYIVRYAKQFLGKTNQDITNLFVGDRCMAYRLNMLNTAIRKNPKYKRLAKNPLIQALYVLEDSEETWVRNWKCKKPCFISIADTAGSSSANSDMIVDGWEDLLNDDDQFVRAFARDLIVYAYMTSGENAGWNNLFKYVPSSWTEGKIDNFDSLSDFIKRRLHNGDFGSFINLDDIAANNYNDYTFCKPLPYRNKDGFDNVIYSYNEGSLIAIRPGTNAPLYISRRIYRTYDQSSYVVYRHIGDMVSTEKQIIPLYQAVGTKGYSDSSRHKILEYGWKFNYLENVGKASAESFDEFIENLKRYQEQHPDKFVDISGVGEYIDAVNKFASNEEIDGQENETDENALEYTSMSEISMYSGGARGADSVWDFYSRKNGITNIIHIRDKENQKLAKGLSDRGISAVVLTDEQMQEARDRIRALLGIDLKDSLKDNLKARNYYQVTNADAVFAVAKLADDRKGVKGGTNMAVQLSIATNKPVHVFDVTTEHWYKYDTSLRTFLQEDTPILTKNFAGIGTRDIENYLIQNDQHQYVDRPGYVGREKANVALKAIEEVFNKTKATLNEPVEVKQQNKYSTEKVSITMVNYTQQTCEDNQDINFVFTENAQAANQLHGLGYDFGTSKATLNVRNTNGNLAVVRTNLLGNPTPNAFGIVVKKRQQDDSGKWLAATGCFKDTEEDWQMFVDMNTSVLNQLSTADKPIVFPNQMALGKASLPLRFATWLLGELTLRFGVISAIRSNNNPGYDFGYGLRILGVANSKKEINVWSGNDNRSNPEFSNFANRPVKVQYETKTIVKQSDGSIAEKTKVIYCTYNTPEGAFLAQKLRYSSLPVAEKDKINEQLQTATGAQARSIGRSIPLIGVVNKATYKLAAIKWDDVSFETLRLIMMNSFILNPNALEKLLRTDGIFTHKNHTGQEQDGGRFSSILNEIKFTLSPRYLDEDRFGTKQELLATLQSDNTILTNDEITKLFPYTGSDTKPRIAVASEHTDPAFFANQIERWARGEHIYYGRKNRPIDFQDIDALYVITKHDGLPIKKILSLGKPVILHFTVTTLGDTKWEKGVMKWLHMIEHIGDLIKQGLDPEFVTLRIDPIIPGVTKINEVETLIKRASELGIKHVRFSILDYYKSTAPAMIKLGFDYSKYFDSDGRGGFERNARTDYRLSVAAKIKAMTDKYGMDLSTCAEGSLVPGVKKEGCLSPHAINEMLGTHIIDKEELNNNSRELCTCYGGKQDVLSYNVNCASVCTYCYAHHGSDRMAEYYNEDGTLKDNDLTRTTKGRAFAMQEIERKELLNNERQVERVNLKELGVSENDMKKAEEVKNHCKGGK